MVCQIVLETTVEENSLLSLNAVAMREGGVLVLRRYLTNRLLHIYFVGDNYSQVKPYYGITFLDTVCEDISVEGVVSLSYSSKFCEELRFETYREQNQNLKFFQCAG